MWPPSALCNLFTSLRAPFNVELGHCPGACAGALVIAPAESPASSALTKEATHDFCCLQLPISLDDISSESPEQVLPLRHWLGFAGSRIYCELRDNGGFGRRVLFHNYHQSWRPTDLFL